MARRGVADPKSGHLPHSKRRQRQLPDSRPHCHERDGGVEAFLENLTITGPGSDIEVKTAQLAATTLADGMNERRIMIWTQRRSARG